MQLLEVIRQLDSDEMLMYASDYPHWHADTDETSLAHLLPEPLRAKVMSENARNFYRL